MTEALSADPPAKLDPETFELRAKPARAIRFRRGAIIGAAAVGSASLIGIAWFALKPQIARQLAHDSELSQPATNAARDALAGSPSSYAQTPKLGPPLPGDLGRPILRAQEQAGSAAPSSHGDNGEARLQQQRAEQKAALESGLLVGTASTRDGAVPAPTDPVPTIPATAPVAEAQTRKEQFGLARDNASDLNSHGLVPLASSYTLLAGSVIPASLITGLNSDLPGMVTAQVTRNVYDTVTGHILLVPQGARLLGKYDSVVAFGQKRALVIWQRLILPNGGSVRLDNMPAIDPSGYVGLADKVDFHTWTLLKGVALATMLGVGSELTISGEDDLVEAIRQSAQSNTARAGDQITQRNLDIQPTITVRPGAPVQMLVTRDLVIEPYRE